MIILIPFKLLFAVTTVIGAAISLTSSNLLWAFVGLELGTFSFIALIQWGHTHSPAESSSRYFISQTSGSFIFIAGCLIIINSSDWTNTTGLIIFIGLAIKIGVAPIHFWVPSIIARLRWEIIALVSTLQKAAPLGLISHVIQWVDPTAPILFAACRAVIGAIGGFGQVSLRILIAYSSISHVGWLTLARIFRGPIAWYYLATYSSIVIPLCGLLSHLITKTASHTVSSRADTYWLLIRAGLLSLGGLPPLSGFFIKASLLNDLISGGIPAGVPVILVLASTVNLAFYIKVIYPTLIIISSKPRADKKIQPFSGGIFFFTLIAWNTVPFIF